MSIITDTSSFTLIQINLDKKHLENNNKIAVMKSLSTDTAFTLQ